MEDTFETRSVCSNTSHSQRSSASVIAARPRAKAEATRAQASFARQEADVIKAQAYIEEQQKAAAEAARKKAELQASLHTLRLESVAAAAIAKANVLETAAENEFGELDRASLKSEYAEYSKYAENLKPNPHQQSRLPEPLSTPVCLPTMDMDNGPSPVSFPAVCKNDASEVCHYELHDLPVHQTSGLKENISHITPKFKAYAALAICSKEVRTV